MITDAESRQYFAYLRIVLRRHFCDANVIYANLSFGRYPLLIFVTRNLNYNFQDKARNASTFAFLNSV